MRGFLNGGGYDGIPLEINAYALGGRFERNPRTRISVADEVGAWVREGRFQLDLRSEEFRLWLAVRQQVLADLLRGYQLVPEAPILLLLPASTLVPQ